jgi:hypothetical protein
MLAQRFAFAQLLQRVPDAQDLANDERPALNRSRVPAQTCSGTPTRRVNVKSSSDAVAYPVFATPDGLCKDRPRNVAQVGPCTTKYDRARPSTTERGRTRRGVRIRSEFADSPAPWPNGWQTVGQTLVQPLGQGRAAVVKMPDRRWQKPAKVAGFFCCIALGKVDRNRRRTLYRPLGCAAARRVGASAKPLTVYTVTEHPAMLVAMFASPRRMRGGLLFDK